MEQEIVRGNGGFCLNAPLNVDEVYKELSRLGSFKPHDVVEVARDPSSPLHKYFEWNDGIAAEGYRLSQARSLVISVKIETPTGPIRAFENITVNSSNYYVPISKIKKSSTLQEQVLENALRELTYWKAKYRSYENYFGPVFSAIAEVEKKGAAGGKKEKSRGSRRGSKVNRSANSKKKSDDYVSRRYAINGK